MRMIKKEPCEAESRRVTVEDIKDIRSSARASGDRYMLALTYVMEQLADILWLLKQQNQTSNGSDHRCSGTDDSEHQ